MSRNACSRSFLRFAMRIVEVHAKIARGMSTQRRSPSAVMGTSETRATMAPGVEIAAPLFETSAPMSQIASNTTATSAASDVKRKPTEMNEPTRIGFKRSFGPRPNCAKRAGESVSSTPNTKSDWRVHTTTAPRPTARITRAKSPESAGTNNMPDIAIEKSTSAPTPYKSANPSPMILGQFLWKLRLSSVH